MRRFPFPDLPEIGQTLRCPPEHRKHLLSVLRLKVGEEIQGTFGDGTVARLRAVSVYKEEILFRVVSKNMGQEKALQAYALVAELKSDAMDDALAILAEQGIPQIFPFFAERSVPKFDSKDVEKKRQRRQRLAEEAVKKVGGLYGCRVHSSLPLKNMGSFGEIANKILFHEDESISASILTAFDFSLPTIFAIGPEGGFTAQETEFLRSKGFQRASLGTRILRASTACSAAAALIRYHTEALSQK